MTDKGGALPGGPLTEVVEFAGRKPLALRVASRSIGADGVEDCDVGADCGLGNIVCEVGGVAGGR